MTDELHIVGGTVSATGNEAMTPVAAGDLAEIIQDGGSNTVSHGMLTIGATSPSTVSYLLNTGTLSAQNESVLAGGNAISQAGGSNNVGALTVAGAGAGGNGYVLSGGSLTAGSITVASGGGFSFGHNTGADFGTLTIAGSVTQGGGNEVLDASGQTHASYTVNQTGGSNNVAGGALELGVAAGNTGVYTLSGGAVSAQAEAIGVAGNATFTQTGGTNTVAGVVPVTLSTGDSVAASTVTVGVTAASSGTYNLQGGTLNGAVEVTQYGTFNLSGGSAGAITNDGSFSETAGGSVGTLTNNNNASVAGVLAVTGSGSNAGTLTLTGGTLSTAGSFANTGSIAGYGTIGGTGGTGGLSNSGVLTQSGGNLIVAATGSNDNTGEIDLQHGTTTSLQVASGVTLVNDGLIALNGGVLSGAGTLANNSGLIGGTGRITVATFHNDGTLNADAGLTSVTGLFSNHGIVEMTGPSALLSGSILNNFGTIEGAGRINNGVNDQGGTIQAVGGTLTLGGVVTTTGRTTLLTTTGTKILAAGGMSGNVGTISLAGGSFDNGGAALTNNGTISGYGTFASGGLTNNRSVLVAGGTTTFNGSVTNAVGGTVTVDHAAAVFNGAVTNNGTFTTIGGTASYAGIFTNNGAVFSDPSTQTFSSDLVEGSGGSIQASAGDVYLLEGGFLNHSTQRTTWNTLGAALEFASGGASSLHDLLLAGADLGATAAGYADNFAWGTLTIDAGQSLSLGTGTGSDSVAFYADSVVGALIDGTDITNIDGNGFDIFYDPLATANGYLGGKTYSLADGGALIADSMLPAPEPAASPCCCRGWPGWR